MPVDFVESEGMVSNAICAVHDASEVKASFGTLGTSAEGLSDQS